MICPDPDCKTPISESLDRCTRCGHFAGYPNVRAAERDEEAQALDARYQAARDRAAAEGRLANLDRFESRMHSTCAVINVELDFLHSFLTNDKALYTTYALAVRGQIRKPADLKNDRHRRAVEAMMFGEYGERIRYAALSLDGAGVTSYGPYAMRLSDVAVRKRASLLEENSYDFVDRHDLRPSSDLPLGFTSTWGDRHKLALAKLAGDVTADTSDDQYPGILLFSEGDHSTDRFVEVHIYDSFDAGAIESVRGSSGSKDKVVRAKLERIKDEMDRLGQTWVEA